MKTAWTPAEASGNVITPQDGFVAANANADEDEDASQEREHDETRERDIPERAGKPRRKRGRNAKDPLHQIILFHCRSAEELETTLRDYLKDVTSPPEHTTVQFHFPVTSAFMVYPFGHSQAIKDPLKRIFSKSAVSVVEALQTTPNLKDQIEKQRAIAKACVEAVARADGYKYSSNNNWISKEDQASRFSYFCNDSSLNRARAGNPAASNRVAHKKGHKPVYNCEGTIGVKFSVTKQLLEVQYKHIPCHETYAARAPIPRKGTRRRILMELFEPDALPNPRDLARAKAAKEGMIVKQRTTGEASPAIRNGQGILSEGDGSSSALPEISGEGRQDKAEPIMQLDNTAEAGTSALSEPPIRLTETLNDLQDNSLQNNPARSQPPSRKRQSNVDEVDLENRLTKKQISTEARATKQAADPNVPAAQQSELDILKAKLAQAEQRINRLEAEKRSPAPPIPYPAPHYYPAQASHHPLPPHYHYPHAHPPYQQSQPYSGYGQPPPGYTYPVQAPYFGGYGIAKPPDSTQQQKPAAPYLGFGMLKPVRSEILTEPSPRLLSGVAEAGVGKADIPNASLRKL